MSGAADDWAYEHLGVFSWTTEFWDVVHAATGAEAGDRLLVPRPDRRAGARRAALGRRARPRPVRRLVPVRPPAARPRRARRLAPPRHLDEPAARPAARRGHAARRASPSPRRWRRRAWRSSTRAAVDLGGGTWRVEAGIANTGWLPTHGLGARRQGRPHPADHRRGDGRRGRGRRRAGAAAASASSQGGPPLRFGHWHDGTPDRVLATGSCGRPPGRPSTVVARHERAGQSAVDDRRSSVTL